MSARPCACFLGMFFCSLLSMSGQAPPPGLRMTIVSGDGQRAQSNANGFEATFGQLVVQVWGWTDPKTRVDFRCSAPSLQSCTLDGSHDHVSVMVDREGMVRVPRPSFRLRDPLGTDGRVDATIPNSNAKIAFALHIQPAPLVNMDVIKTYAPLIYLHPDELYMPSSIDAFFYQVHMECDGKSFGLKSVWALTAADMPDSHMGAESEHYRDARCRFTTNDPMKGPYDHKPFFRGQTPTPTQPVPVYVDTYDIKSPNTFTAQYTTFYPWNEGKNACAGLAPNDHCLGAHYMVDDHVGDWEMASIQFIDGKPVVVHVGAHGNRGKMAATFYAPNWGTDLKWEGTHPVVYSASGSHGVWATEGTHNYDTIDTGERLFDYTGKGARWETWGAIVLMGPYVDPKYKFLLNEFRGDWGNFHQGDDPCTYMHLDDAFCRLPHIGIPVGSEYQLNDGPGLPLERDRDYMVGGVLWNGGVKFTTWTFPSAPVLQGRMGGIMAGSDGAMWFAENSYMQPEWGQTGKIGRITMGGVVSEYPTGGFGAPSEITAGPAGTSFSQRMGNTPNSFPFFTFPGKFEIGFLVPDASGFYVRTLSPRLPQNPPIMVPGGITTGPDEAVWFTESSLNIILREANDQAYAYGDKNRFNIPTPNAGPTGITTGPDNAMWFTEAMGNKIGRIATHISTWSNCCQGELGTITEFPTPTPASNPRTIVAGPDGALWFTERKASKIGRITTDGHFTEFALADKSEPESIVVGPDGALWFTEFEADKIGRITTAGEISEIPIPDSAHRPPWRIALGPDGNLWFTEWDLNANPNPTPRVVRMEFGASGNPADIKRK